MSWEHRRVLALWERLTMVLNWVQSPGFRFRTRRNSQSNQRLNELMGVYNYARISINGKDIWLVSRKSKSWLCCKHIWMKTTERKRTDPPFRCKCLTWLHFVSSPNWHFISSPQIKNSIWFCNVKTIIALRKKITELSVPSVYAFNKHSVSKRIECLFVLWFFSTTTSEFCTLMSGKLVFTNSQKPDKQ